MTTRLTIAGKLTPRENLLIETESGVAVTAIRSVLEDDERPKMKLLNALALVALRRQNPKATMDDVLDGDFEIVFDRGESEATSPLPPPSAGSD